MSIHYLLIFLPQVQSELKSDKDLIGQLQSEKVSLEVKAAEVEEQKEGMYNFKGYNIIHFSAQTFSFL